MNPLATLPGRVAVVVLLQLALVGAAVAPQLSARLLGEEYLLRVAPLDPIDPFRGAYVDLTYPDLDLDRDPFGDPGIVFLVLAEEGGVWVATEMTLERPAEGPYLTCDDSGFRVRCGIESWFLPQDEARALEQTVATGDAVATVRIDGRGNAALVAVSPRRPPG
jgi:uncharacterized membrane-anchored protein